MQFFMQPLQSETKIHFLWKKKRYFLLLYWGCFWDMLKFQFYYESFNGQVKGLEFLQPEHMKRIYFGFFVSNIKKNIAGHGLRIQWQESNNRFETRDICSFVLQQIYSFFGLVLSKITNRSKEAICIYLQMGFFFKSCFLSTVIMMNLFEAW